MAGLVPPGTGVGGGVDRAITETGRLAWPRAGARRPLAARVAAGPCCGSAELTQLARSGFFANLLGSATGRLLGAVMLRSNPIDSYGSPGSESRFVLYVEGPSDCDILRSWSRLVSPGLSRAIGHSSVILGGRRPARAVEHFDRLLSDSGLARGVCVLDRDGHADVADDAPNGLQFFTWPRRHIESYLLIPTAMRRCMRMPAGDRRLAEVLGDLPVGAGEERLRDLDAKRLLAGKSAVARELGATLSATRIARCMGRHDLHADVLQLLGLLGTASQVQPRRA